MLYGCSRDRVCRGYFIAEKNAFHPLISANRDPFRTCATKRRRRDTGMDSRDLRLTPSAAAHATSPIDDQEHWSNLRSALLTHSRKRRASRLVGSRTNWRARRQPALESAVDVRGSAPGTPALKVTAAERGGARARVDLSDGSAAWSIT